MSIFIGIISALTLLVIAALVRPLLRPGAQHSVSSERLNASIYKDQLATLERDLANGAISPTDYESTRDELQLRLLDDTAAPERPAATTGPGFWTARRTAALIALTLPLLSVSTYRWLGDPAALNPGAAQETARLQITQMVESLESKLKAEPNNPQGWAMLARSYKVMGRLDEAEQAYEKATDAIRTHPDLLVDYAELLAMKAQHRMDGRPEALVRQALAIDPEHPSALMMSGVVAYQHGDFDEAVKEWEKLLSLLEPGSEDARMTQENLDDARAQSALAKAQKPRP